MSTFGKVTGIVANLVTVQVDGPVAENELCYIKLHGTDLLAEVIKLGRICVNVILKDLFNLQVWPCPVLPVSYII